MLTVQFHRDFLGQGRERPFILEVGKGDCSLQRHLRKELIINTSKDLVRNALVIITPYVVQSHKGEFTQCVILHVT